MKRYIPLILALCLLLSACAGVQIPDNTTTSPDGTSLPEETTAPAADDSQLAAEHWLVNDREPLGYEDLFSQDRLYAHSGAEWLCADTLFEVKWSRDSWQIRSDAYDSSYDIPNSKAYTDLTLLAADGKWLYLYDDTQIVQMEMRSGTVKELVKETQLLQVVLYSWDVLYYTAVDAEGKTSFVRYYIPSGNKDILYRMDAPPVWFRLENVYSTQSPIILTMMNPEMVEIVKAELADPNSAYKTKYAVADLWDQEEPLQSTGNNLAWLCYYIQEETGVKALMKVTVEPVSGTVGEKLGIIDNCWFGSDLLHDHYSPEITEAPDLTLNVGPWTTFAGQTDNGGMLRKDPTVLLYAKQFRPQDLYILDSGKVAKVADVAVLEMICSEDFIYCITAENTVVQISKQTLSPQMLYTADETLAQLSCSNGNLCFLDGNTVIQMDLAQLRWHTVLTGDYIATVQAWSDGQVYLLVRNGMYCQSYIYDPTAGALEKTTII